MKFVSTVLDSNSPFTEEDFYNVILKNWKQEEVTLIFNVWSLKYCIRTTYTYSILHLVNCKNSSKINISSLTTPI